MLDASVERETIDGAAERFGMPMGVPIELADTVGLAFCLYVADTLKSVTHGPMPGPLLLLRSTRSQWETSAARPAKG